MNNKYFEGVCLVDTTVILAQPRVPRLRADAVYVDHRGIRGHPRANRQIHCFVQGMHGAGTPSWSPTPQQNRCGTGAKTTPK